MLTPIAGFKHPPEMGIAKRTHEPNAIDVNIGFKNLS
jgi:hypothetical protein